MPRLFIAAALLASAALTGTAHAQYYGDYGERPMPAYDDGEPRDPGGYYDSYGTQDVRGDAGPVDEDELAQYREASHWVRPRPYARADQVDEGTPNDAAHRADRAYTSELNRNAYARSQRNGGARGRVSSRDQAEYRAARAHYAERMANWRARVDACESGHYDACE